MAAEKQPDRRQSIVDQDAAITAYLDGLLRDPEADTPPEGSAPRRSPGLKVINVPEAPVAAEPVPEPTAPVETSTVGVEDSAGTDANAASDGVADSGQAEPESPEEMTDEESTVAESTPVEAATEETASEPGAIDDEPVMPATSAPSAEPVEPAADDRWAWLRVGGMTMALPASAMTSRHADPALDPVPGAPAHVAGALNVDGRPRLILSLAALTGLRERDNATREVFLLGKGGLWGVVGERVDQPPALDDESVEWRSEAQKADRRPWLSGTASAMGVAVLDESGLRAALRASR